MMYRNSLMIENSKKKGMYSMYMLNFVLNETVIVHKDFHDRHATFPRLPKYFKLDLKQTHFFSIAFLNFVQHDILSSQSEQQ